MCEDILHILHSYLDLYEVWVAHGDQICIGLDLLGVPRLDQSEPVYCPLSLSVGEYITIQYYRFPMGVYTRDLYL